MRLNQLPIYFAVITVLIFGLTTIWSTTNQLFITQLLFAILAIIVVYIFSKIDLTIIFSFSWFYYFISITLLLLTLIIGQISRGSTRWIDLGPRAFQTSEIVKPLLAVFFANFLASGSPKKIANLFRFLFLSLIPIGLIFFQPDLGSAIIIVGLALVSLYVAGIRYRYLILGLIIGLVAFVPLFNFMKPYQQSRLISFTNPYADPSHTGYNTIQSVIAIGSGKIIGLGVKQGTQSHLKFLPERHTDFVYASFAEEFGLLGSSLLILSFLTIGLQLLKIAKTLSQPREIILCSGIFIIFVLQIIINLGMNLGVMPVTGITLPFMSYGGSSLISLAILLGLSLNLSRHH